LIVTATHIALIRGVLMLAAVLFETNTIPTGVEGGGTKVAATLMAVALMIAAGDKTPQLVKDAAVEQLGLGQHLAPPMTAQGFIAVPGRENNPLPNNQTDWISFAVKVLITILTALIA
jgi:hypothetical protein